jgi:hypothetical protein
MPGCAAQQASSAAMGKSGALPQSFGQLMQSSSIWQALSPQ